MQNSWAIIQVNSLGNTADRGFQMPCGWRRVNWRKQERHSKGYPSFGQIWFHSGSLGKPVVGRYWAVGWCDLIQLWSKAAKVRQKRSVGVGRKEDDVLDHGGRVEMARYGLIPNRLWKLNLQIRRLAGGEGGRQARWQGWDCKKTANTQLVSSVSFS